MYQKKQFRFSRIRLAAFAIGLFFFTLSVTHSSCGGDKPVGLNQSIKVSTPYDSLVRPVLSGIVPGEPLLPATDTLSPEDNRPFFDRLSWQTFIALCWPVVKGQRGTPLNPNDPATFLGMSNTTPVVWTSYKNQWDLFGQGANTPSPWNDWMNPVSLCGRGDTIRHVFGTAKSGMLPGEGNESFSVPLVDQNQNYVLFEIKYNEPQYNFIVNNGFYLKSNLVKYQIKHKDTLQMPSSTASSQGSILVKAAWKLLGPNDDRSRYYVIDELVHDPVSNTCKKQTMGLVGLHIAQKVGGFPQWVWSSFEQVDNVPDPNATKGPYSFNNGKPDPATPDGYANKPDSNTLLPDKSQRVPVQVTRLNPIPVTPKGFSTVDINRMYQNAVRSTWMQYYELVITQWPTQPDQFITIANGGVYPQNCGQAFPVKNCVNTTMETYFQSQNDAAGAGGNSCMSCHYTATTDFSWSLQLRSH